MPGLVNCHTHLELTGFAGQVEEPAFPAWIRKVRALKEVRTADDFEEAARRGLAQCFAAGVTTIAETGDSGAVVGALHALGGRGVVYQEVFGPHPDQRDEALGQLQERFAALQDVAGPAIRVGVSPHAPYTVSGPLYRAVADWAREEAIPLAVHIAESHAEHDLLQSGTGPFRDAWDTRGIPLPEPLGDAPVGWLDRHGVLQAGTLCIHCVQVGSHDIALLAERGCAVAHCPRSNRCHGHGDAPLGAMLDAGIPVGVGTDSEASTAPDLLAEARLAAELAGLSPSSALALATSGAARAIGWGDEVGALARGLWGDIVVRALPDPDQDSPDWVVRAVIADRTPVLVTYVGGVERYRDASA
jgi:5-methylthioadenosine/S-adenosylhomocysteine deaminase